PFTRRFARKVLFNLDRNEQEPSFISCKLISIGNLQESLPSSSFEEEKCFLIFLAKRSYQMLCKKSALH
ncbi:MAG: hypothetical protein IJM24_07890, partial [Clostridia bacterium]|nr:hypothetical protein [Clostridia bacterium]